MGERIAPFGRFVAMVLTCCILIIGVINEAYADPTEVYKYSHTPYAASGTEYPLDLALDSSENLYVADLSDLGMATDRYQFVLLKYDSSGQKVWQVTENTTSVESARLDLTTDEEVLVIHSGSFSTFAPDGSELSSATFETMGISDHLLGNDETLYLVGTSQEYAFRTTVIESDGTEKWTVDYQGADTVSDHGTAIDVDPTGNIYVAGYSCTTMIDHDDCNDADLVVIKYNPAGETEWADVYHDDTVNGPNVAFDLGIAPDGNIIVSGQQCSDWYDSGDGYTNCMAYNLLIMSYLPDGTRNWLQVSQGPSNFYSDYAQMRIDSGSNIFTAVRVPGISIRMNDSTGANQWDQAQSTIDYLADMTLDSNERPVVTGTNDWRYGDIILTSLAHDGSLLWEDGYDAVGRSDRPEKIISDTNGSLYVLGSSEGPETKRDLLMLKYGDDGTFGRAIRYNSEGFWDIQPADLALDEQGNLFIAGKPEVGNAYNCVGDALIIKIDAAGNLLWQQTYQGAADGLDVFADIETDSMGNVIATGKTCAPDENYLYGICDFITLKYDPDGNLLWSKTVAGDGHDEAVALAIDENDNIYVAGQSSSNGESTACTVKYAPDGTELWMRHHSCHADTDRKICVGDMKLDHQENVVVAGRDFNTTLNSEEIMVLRYDSDGNLLNEGAKTTGNYSFVYDLAIDLDDNAVLAASLGSSIFTVKFSNTGAYLWGTIYSSELHPVSGTQTMNVRTDQNENVYIASTTGPYTSYYSEYRLIKYTPDGQEIWAVSYFVPNEAFTEYRAMEIDRLGNSYITGYSIVDPNYKQVTIKYDPDGTKLWTLYGENTKTTFDARMLVTDVLDIYLVGSEESITGDQGTRKLIAWKFTQECDGCKINNVCYGDGEVAPENPCLKCDATLSDHSWSDFDGAQCDDSLYCNGGDSCLSGTCSAHIGDPCSINETCNETDDICELLTDDDDAVDDDDAASDDDTADDDDLVDDDDADDDHATDDDDSTPADDDDDNGGSGDGDDDDNAGCCG